MKLLITGVGGLVGSECAKFFIENQWSVVGIDNNSRMKFFGVDGSVAANINSVMSTHPFLLEFVDICNFDNLERIFKINDFDAIIHTAAQPSHDKASSIPLLDFNTNALGTLNLLELTRQYCPNSPFIFTSTNKVYGDQPNALYYEENETRFTPSDPWYQSGFSEELSIDQCKHSLFGCSKLSADIYCQEYGKYFGLKTCIFRLGCITGSSHQGAKLHGFLNYLVKCAISKTPYEIIGYSGKQVRDQIHARDLARLFGYTINNPVSGEVFNMGGGLVSNCSVLEAISMVEDATGNKLHVSYQNSPRIGDHKWYVSDVSKFYNRYKTSPILSIGDIINELVTNLK